MQKTSKLDTFSLFVSIFVVMMVFFSITINNIFSSTMMGNLISLGLSLVGSYGLTLKIRSKRLTGGSSLNWTTPYHFLFPAVLVLVVVVAFPLLYGFYLSMTNMSLSSFKNPQLVWFHNYLQVFTDPRLLSTLLRTVMWTAINVFFHVALGLLLALQLNKRLPGKAIFRVLLIIPWALPQYVAVSTWKGMFNESFGVVNSVLHSFGIAPVAWFGDAHFTFLASIITNIWLGFPFMMMIALGGLQSIPKDIYEAADIDGAGSWSKFVNITLPLLKPILVPATVLGSVWTFNMVNVILILSGGQGSENSQILVTEVYRLAFTFYRYGFAAAYSVIIFFILLIFTFVAVRKSGVLESGGAK